MKQARRADITLWRKLEMLDTPARQARVHGRTGTTQSADINITPLVDVVLVLLIIFMVVTPMLAREIALPRVVSPMSWVGSEDEIRVAIDAKSTLFVGKEEVSRENLPKQLAAAVNKSKSRHVYLEVDQEVDFALVRVVLEVLRDLGLSTVGLGALVDAET